MMAAYDLKHKRIIIAGCFPTFPVKDVHRQVGDIGGRVTSSVSARTDLLIVCDSAVGKTTKK